MKNNTKKALIWTGVITAGIAAASAVSHKITKSLVTFALDRKEPKSISRAKRKVSGSSDAGEFFAEVEKAAKKLEASECEKVEITSRDGTLLTGHWHFCDNARRTIIAMHGWRSSWTQDFGIIADFWHESGCNVLYAEQRGQNNSGGDYMGFGLLERYDCLDWIEWVNGRCRNKLPVYLAGVSMGAATVLMAAGLDLPQNVHGIAADCGFTSAHDIWKHVANNNLHISYGLHSSAADELCRRKIQIGTNDYTTLDAMRKCTVPVLFIHGTDDRFVPVTMTYENYKACAAPKRLLIVPGADHGMSYLVDRENYEAAVKSFWHDFD